MKQKIMKTPFVINTNVKSPIVYTFASSQLNGKLYKTDDNGLTVNMHRYDNIIINFYNSIRPTTFRLFLHITYLVNDDSNVIYLSPKNTTNKMNISIAAFRLGIEELIKYNIMAKTDVRNTYIINHRILFNGDLRQFYEDYKFLYPDQEGEIF